MELKKPNIKTFNTYAEYKTAQREYRQKVWKQTFSEVLNSEFVQEEIKDTMDSIARGETTFDKPYGFGEGCYYKTKRAMLEAIIYDAFNEEIEEQCPTMLRWLYEKVQEALPYMIGNPKELKDYVDGDKVVVEVNYCTLLETVREEMDNLLKEMTEEQIDQCINEVVKKE